ncbi:hypothetical protein AGMMS50212_14610 [Spirochaetia bacterium]|nr:hypothetical protein AGMMS50212_14610 [Spirochaetia bacterium]
MKKNPQQRRDAQELPDNQDVAPVGMDKEKLGYCHKCEKTRVYLGYQLNASQTEQFRIRAQDRYDQEDEKEFQLDHDPGIGDEMVNPVGTE